jgi:hypothetical protein
MTWALLRLASAFLVAHGAATVPPPPGPSAWRQLGATVTSHAGRELRSGGLALLAAPIVNGARRPELTDSVAIGLLTAAAVFLWRKSANQSQLNTDGLHAHQHLSAPFVDIQPRRAGRRCRYAPAFGNVTRAGRIRRRRRRVCGERHKSFATSPT